MANGTYNNDPEHSPTDAVRFLANDRNEPFRLSDSEIHFLITRNASHELAAAEAAEMIGGALSTMADKTVGPLSIKYSSQAAGFFSLAKSLRAKSSAVGGPIMTQGEYSVPLFDIGMHDNGYVAREYR